MGSRWMMLTGRRNTGSGWQVTAEPFVFWFSKILFTPSALFLPFWTCVRRCAGHWGCSEFNKRGPFSRGAYSLVKREEKHAKKQTCNFKLCDAQWRGKVEYSDRALGVRDISLRGNNEAETPGRSTGRPRARAPYSRHWTTACAKGLRQGRAGLVWVAVGKPGWQCKARRTLEGAIMWEK